MAKKVEGYIKLQIEAGKATPAPPVGPALGQHGLNIVQKGAGNSLKETVATISKADLQQIAETKMQDLNAASIEAAMSMIAGTARSMGIKVED